MKNIDMVKNWLLYSGIQNTTSDNSNGSFNSWYNIENKTYPFRYSEITGYGITTLLYLYQISKEQILLERAEMAGNWIIVVAMQGGIVRSKDYYDKTDETDSFENGLAYVFDNGMVLYGLINLYNQTGEKIYLDAAKGIADFLLGMQNPDSLYQATYDIYKKKSLDEKGKWSLQPGSYHAKLALGLLEIGSILDDPKYRKSIERFCEQATKFQNQDDRFLTSGKSTNLHPHCYSAEGFFFIGMKLKENRFIDIATNAVKWALENQLENGGIPSFYENNEFDTNERMDVLAQVLRLGVLLIQYGKLDEGYKERLDKIKKRLLEFQNTSQVHKGGFFYGFENGRKINHINSWCSMFALQALQFYDLYFNKKQDISIDLLI